MFAQLKAYIAGGVLAIILGLSATVYIQHGRNENLSEKFDALSSVKAGQDKTISKLTGEVSSGNKTCNERIADLDKRIRNFKKIDEAKAEKSHEPIIAGPVDSKGGGTNNGADTVLDLLNRMIPAK
jgi:hypothetical protein